MPLLTFCLLSARTGRNLLPVLGLTAAAGVLVLGSRPAVTAPAALKIDPPQARLRLGEGVQFKARLDGRDATVHWKVEGAGGGSITSGGFYQAPTRSTTPASIRLVASIDGGDALGRAEATVHLLPVEVSASPEVAELAVGENAQFKAKVEGAGDSRVAWSVESPVDAAPEAVGKVSESGFFTMPARFTTPGTVLVRATAKADPTKFAVISVRVKPVEIKVEEKAVTVKHGIGRRFTAEVKGAPNTAVEWSLQDPTQGRISANGLYKTPEKMSTPADVLVIARAAADPSKSATLRVRVEPIQINIGVAMAKGEKKKGRRGTSFVGKLANEAYRTAVPSVVRLIMPFDPVDMLVRGPSFKGKSGKQYAPLGGTVALDANVLNTTDDRVQWEVVGNRIGEISQDGVFRVPEAMTTPQVVQVKATSLADPTKSAVQTINIPPVLVQAEKDEFTCPMGSTVQLMAAVENSENRKLVWTVEGGEKFGLVTPDGLYQPPTSLTTPATVLVKAVSVADPSKFATLRVTVPAVGLELSPDRAEVKPGRSVRLRVSVPGKKNAPAEVTWKLSPQVGEITPDGTYVAPEHGGAQTVQVTATLVADPSKTAIATLRLTGK